VTWATLDGAPPRIIAHRGASGLRPEHTLSAYDLGLAQGADIIEPDLVVNAEGVLIVRHDMGLSRSTNVADLAEFAKRRKADVQSGEDWWITDFSSAELTRLRARQPFPVRDQSFVDEPIPSFNEVLAWMRERRRDRPFGLYPEIKHPDEFRALGLDATGRLIDDLRMFGFAGSGSAVWVQCFRIEPLRRVHESIGNPVFALLESAAIDGLERLKQHLGAHPWLAGYALPKSVLYGPYGPAVMDVLHSAGKQVHAWTLRDDQVAPGHHTIDDELDCLFALGVDALFCDFPGTAVAARARFGRGLNATDR